MVDLTAESVMGLLGGASSMGASNLLNMVAFTVGLVLYAIFVWHFHRFIGRRDVFSWDTEKFERSGGLGKFAHGFAYFVKYLIAYPVIVFIWFGVFATFLFVLGNNIDIPRALMVSFAMVTGIRVCSYYKEELAIELAKLLPFALLATYLVLPSAFDIGAAQRVMSLGTFVFDLLGFMVFSVFAEWVIRIIWSIKRRLAPHVHPELDIVERFGR